MDPTSLTAMEVERNDASKDACAQNCVFRIFDLPRELQDIIFELSAECTVKLLHTTLQEVPPSFSLPNLTSITNVNGKKDNENNGNDDHVDEIPANDNDDLILAFRIRLATPLRLVSKAVNIAVRDHLNRKHRQYHSLFAKTIHRDRLIAPSSTFLEICSESHFVLATTDENVYTFLERILPQLQPYAQEIVIWPGREGGLTARIERPDYARLLRNRCRKIVFDVPWVPEFHPHSIQSIVDYSIEEVYDIYFSLISWAYRLLVDRKISVDVVRLFFPWLDLLDPVPGREYTELLLRRWEDPIDGSWDVRDKMVGQMIDGVLGICVNDMSRESQFVPTQDTVRILRLPDIKA